jgi:hypothetical protein
MQDFQELADEALADLLQKHGRPTDLKTALRQSVAGMDKRPPTSSVKRWRRTEDCLVPAPLRAFVDFIKEFGAG